MTRPDLPPFLQNYAPRQPEHTFYVDIQAAYNDPNSTEIKLAWRLVMSEDDYRNFSSENAHRKGEILLLNDFIGAQHTAIELSQGLSSLPTNESLTGQRLYVRAFEITYEEFVELGGC